MFENYKVYEIEYGGKKMTFETGKMCCLSNASILVRWGETVVLCNVTASKKPREGIDFFPLSVDFEEKLYSVNRLCDILNLNRSSYYKWLRRKESQVETENRRIIEWVKELYEEQNGILGYRQMTITINRDKNTQYNVKRIRRLMRYLRLKVCLPQKTGKLYSVHTGNNSRKHFES